MSVRQIVVRRMMMYLLALVMLGSGLAAAAPSAPDHAAWSRLLQSHVRWTDDGHTSQVDYAGLAGERAALTGYLKTLSDVSLADFERWDQPERQAFLINAYNAFTVELILSEYPKIDSIRELGGWFSSPWKLEFFQLLGANRSLDELEHDLLRGAADFDEPRIHFAVNCASIGCPALRPEAYRGAQLNMQLEDQTQRFLGDRSRNRVHQRGLEVSKLFDWYADDFSAAESSLANPLGFLARYAEHLSDAPAEREAIRQGQLRLKFTDYDWSLNRSPP